MLADQRREKILELIKESESPLNGSTLSKILGVSRQVIVQDVALLRACEQDIISTNRGYIMGSLSDEDLISKVFKVSHTDDKIEEELSIITNLSGKVVDVYVEHQIYGKVSASLNICNQKDIDKFMVLIQDDKVSPLKNITNNYHYHTIVAPTQKLLDLIELELKEKGFICD